MRRETSAEAVSGLEWCKSSYSSSSEGDSCVEVAAAISAIHVRDSKNVAGPHVGFAPTAWADFVAYAAGG
ncbi:DUF397 domain-containing protein [Streptomyces halstedii]|uniref:DUF397 domain-containing protein n=1 Tax=Streptomyces halstedii TaxID=1944 RepID=UPI003669EE0C